jgi:hypothetical protein
MFATSIRQPSTENGGRSQGAAPRPASYIAVRSAGAVVELGQRAHAEPRLVVVGPRGRRKYGASALRVVPARRGTTVLDADVVRGDVEQQPDVRARGSRGAATTSAASPPKWSATRS